MDQKEFIAVVSNPGPSVLLVFINILNNVQSRKPAALLRRNIESHGSIRAEMVLGRDSDVYWHPS